MVNPFQNLDERLERIEELIKGFKVQEVEQPKTAIDAPMSRKETAVFFDVSIYTVSDWVKRGILKQYKAGNRSYFLRSELIEVLTKSNTTDHGE